MGVFTVADDFAKKTELEQAMQHYKNYTHIRFLEKTSSISDYVEFVNHDSITDSSIGMTGGKQNIRVADWAQWYDIAHEIGHALGLLHEHTRYDRDEYVIIHWDNIAEGKEHNFKKWNISDSGVSKVTTDYDYESLMQYSSNAFADNTSLPTMSRVDGNGTLQKGEKLSTEDMISINNLYPINIEIMGDQYCLLPNYKSSYTLTGNIPELSTVSWSIYPSNGGTITSGQGTKTIIANITSNQIQYIEAKITYPKTGQVFTERLNVQASYTPLVSDINMFKYLQGDGRYTLKALSTDPQATCTWSYEGTSAEFGDLTYPDDAAFLDCANLCKEIYFYAKGTYHITVNATNSNGSSSYTKSNITIYDTTTSSGFLLSPNPVTSDTDVLLTIVDKTRAISSKYIISVYKGEQLVLFFESDTLQNSLDISSLENGEYLVTVEKEGIKAEQKLYIKRKNNNV